MMDRTILVVNTSNMPVVAREASVAFGITVAEYFRDQGYRVAVMIDSLSRWAEALRDIGARLQEMPGEEGYPTAMASRLGTVFERAGRARVLGDRLGAVTLVSAISPPGGDFSEPVTQAALRVTGAVWALDAQLARARQFPAVDWSTSYSLYTVGEMAGLRTRIIALLQRDAELREVASLLGVEEMEDRDRLALAIASIVREHVLGQNAFDPNDAMSSLAKTRDLAAGSLEAFDRATAALEHARSLDELPLADVRRAIAELRRASSATYAACHAELATVLGRIG
jgi:V/A-type H+-transporting ATPase subunit A